MEINMNINEIQKNIDNGTASGAYVSGSQRAGQAYSAGKATSVFAGAGVKGAAAAFAPESKEDIKYGQGAYKDDALESIKNKASGIDVKNQTDYMTLMASTVSEKDMKDVMDGGYEPGKMEPDQIVTIVDRIKTTMAKAGVVVEGYNTDLDLDKIKEITGSRAYASSIKAGAGDSAKVDEYAKNIAESFAKYDVPVTEDNVKAAVSAMEEAEGLAQPDQGAIRYMVENNLAPTISNFYMAIHSGAGMGNGQGAGYFSDGSGYLGKKADAIDGGDASQVTWQDTNLDAGLNKRIEEIIDNSGYEINDSYKADAIAMINSGLRFTEETFMAYEKIKEVSLPINIEERADAIARGIKEGLGAGGADLSTDKTLLEQAEELVGQVNELDDQAVDAVLAKGKTLNIRNLAFEARQIVVAGTETSVISGNQIINVAQNPVDSAQPESANQASYALLQETKLSMTLSSTYFLLKNGIDAAVTDLSLLVDQLKEAENLQFEAVFGRDKSEALIDLYDETQDKLEEIKTLPLATLGLVSVRSSYNLNVVYSEGINLRAAYESAGEKYEPLMTEVRADLGDSIKKAFANVDDILKEMDQELSQDNERAVRILGYNNMEITDENIDKVKKAYSHVKNIIDMMTPGRVLDLIRSGANPLEMSMEDLEAKLGEDPDPAGEAERYSHFLYRMEQSRSITEEEKESYMGIYRMITQTLKDDGAAVGTLINTQGEINFKNLLSAVRTRRNKGMDLKIDDNFGYIDKLVSKGQTIDQQIAKAYMINASENITGDPADYNNLQKAAKVPEEVVTLLENTGIEPTVDNLVSADALLKNSENIFQTIRELSDKSTKKAQNVDKNVDNNRGIGGENISNTVEFETEIDSLIAEVTDKFESREEVNQAFGKMAEATEKMLSDLKEGADNSIDVRSIAASYKQVNVVRALANNDFYQVPVKVGEEYTSVSVRLIRGQEEDKGQVSIYMDHAEYGEITARFSASQDKGLEGMIVCGDDDGLAKLKGKSEAFDQKMDFIEGNKNIIFAKSAVSLKHFLTNTDKEYRNISNGLEGNDGKDAISTRNLYRVAKEFIKTFIAA